MAKLDTEKETKQVCAEKPGKAAAAVSLLSGEDIARLEAFEEGSEGYYGLMLEYLENFMEEGIREGRFTEEEAREDLEIALWYAYACNNLDTYECYYMAAQWMPASEKNAKGCGTWYYRYACALMYCGELEKALAYAEKGVKEEPDYPWGWLQLGRLRSHFGDKEGALKAAERGLELEPGDFEFLTLQKEISEGRTLMEMEYHYIDPEADRQLLEEELEDAEEKQRALAGILLNEEGLKQIWDIFQPMDWNEEGPYCSFSFAVDEWGRRVACIFRMNRSAVSKMDAEWLREQKEALDKGNYLFRQGSAGNIYQLETVIFYLDYRIELVYTDPKAEKTIRLGTQKRDKSEGGLPADASLVDFALAEAEGEGGDKEGGSLVTYYRREGAFLQYAEMWEDEEFIIEHTGTVGEAGEIKQYPKESDDTYSKFLEAFLEMYSSMGYEEWPEEELSWIEVQFPMQPVDFHAAPIVLAEEDAEKKERAVQLLREALGWTGLGTVDGWEMGRDLVHPEAFVMSFYCISVDAQLGVSVIRQALEEEMDCSHLKIAVRKAGEEDYQLVYTENGSDEFSL